MKSVFKVLFAFIFILVTAEIYSQEIQETKISDFTIPGNVDVNDFKMDPKMRNYCYVVWNNDRTASEVHSRNSVSQAFSYVISDQIKFFSNSKYSAIGENYYDSNRKASTTLIVEGKNILTTEYIDWTSSYINKDDVLTVIIKDAEKYYLAKYSDDEGLTRSEPYDELRAAFRFERGTGEEGDDYVHEEEYTLDKNGDRIYTAVRNNKAYLIIGDAVKATPFTDIDNSSIAYDSNGDICFIAKDNGGLYSSPKGFFVVRGDKKYQKFDYVYAPLYFDRSGSIYYVASDSVGEYEYDSYIVKNDKKLDLNNKATGIVSGIFNVNVSPEGNVSYLEWRDIKQMNETSEQYYSSSSYFVKGGKEYFLGYNVRPFVYGTNGKFLYAAQSDPKITKSDIYLFENNTAKKVNSESYDDIYGYDFTPDEKIYFLGMTSDTSSGIYNSSVDLIIDNKKIGDFSFLVYQTEGDSSRALVYSQNGDYAFVTEETITDNQYYSVIYINGKKLDFPSVVTEGSKFFTGIYNMFYSVNNKLFFTATTRTAESYNDNVYEVFVDNISLGKTYNSIGRINYDRGLNVATFLAGRGKALYEVKVKF